MATIVTITSNPASTVSLKPANKSFASLTVAPSSNISLGQLTNIDVANVADGQGLIYSAANGKFVSGSISAIVSEIKGGSF
jgi:hypothetical protein